MRTKQVGFATVVAALVSVVASGCGSNGGDNKSSAAAGSGTTTKAAAKEYKIALSNSFLGNDWRQNMQNVAKWVTTHKPFQGQATIDIANSENSPQAQAASIDGLVQKKVDAIIVDAASPTALNTSIKRACDAGIVVVAFDQNVTAPCAYNIKWDFESPAAHAAEWIAKKMGGKGNLVVDTGLAGVPVSADILKGLNSTLKQYPGIKTVAKYQGQFASAPSAQAFASILATQPKIDGVYTQGYCDVIIKALQKAGRPLVPMYCQGFNGNFVKCTSTKGAECIANPSSPGVSAIAIKVALDALTKKNPSKVTTVSLPLYATDNSVNVGTKVGRMKSVARPDLPSGLTLPAVPPGFGVSGVPPEAMLKN